MPRFIYTKIAALLLIVLPCGLFAQQPRYTPKHLVKVFDTSEFKIGYNERLDMRKTYILTKFEYWDADDNRTTHIRGQELLLINIEGPGKHNKKNGLFTTYLIDSADHKKRYKVYEQEFQDDRLNGSWKIFNLQGALVSEMIYYKDTLKKATVFSVDGKKLMEERVFGATPSVYVLRTFDVNGKLTSENGIKDEEMNGWAREYYEDGSLKREAEFKDGRLDGVFRYFYKGGKLWIEQKFRNGLDWEVIGNYKPDGTPRPAGTLKNGNGTIILYEDDGSIREIATYQNGKRIS